MAGRLCVSVLRVRGVGPARYTRELACVSVCGRRTPAVARSAALHTRRIAAGGRVARIGAAAPVELLRCRAALGAVNASTASHILPSRLFATKAGAGCECSRGAGCWSCNRLVLASHVGVVQPAAARRQCSTSSKRGGGPLRAYKNLVKSGEIREDPRQVSVLKQLQALHDDLVEHDAKEDDWLVSIGFKQRDPPPRGLYMHGSVGCGKTFLMDLLYESVHIQSKRRVHFHDFMLEVHQRLYDLKQAGVAEDPVPVMAADLVKEAWFLCFDEFQVTDIADAMIMGRLFSTMFDKGLVMVATSNRPADDLYKHGLQRKLFLPFIETLKERCVEHDLDSDVDYRLLGTDNSSTYFSPLGPESAAALEAKWTTLSKGEQPRPSVLKTQGRKVEVPQAAMRARVARFTFNDLCAKPLGAADYIVIAKAFPTVFVTDIPLLTMYERNEVRRFITFVDTMYNHHVKLLCTAAGPAMYLFSPNGHTEAGQPIESDNAWGHMDEVFAFERTVSRLTEMRSEEYLSKAWTPEVIMEIPDSDSDLTSSANVVDDVFSADSAFKVLSSPHVFTGVLQGNALTDADLQAIWDRYDLNKDGSLDRDEVRRMLEDVREATTGNRTVSSEDVQAACAELMGHGGSYDDAAEGVAISKEAFFKHCQTMIRQRIM